MAGALSVAATSVAVAWRPAAAQVGPSQEQTAQQLLGQYCSTCHNDKALKGGLSLQSLKTSDLAAGDHRAVWETILRRLAMGEMPPKGIPRPPQQQIDATVHWLQTSLDSYAAAHPDPGRSVLRRMNRAEYANAVRDLLGVDMNIANELPADDAGYGFDNIAAVLTVSPTLLDRYVAAAGKIARQATGQLSRNEFVTNYVPVKGGSYNLSGVPSYNERASSDLPVDSRGGAVFRFNAPYDATYDIQVVLNPNTIHDDEVRKENTVEARVAMKAGSRLIGASFPKTLALNEDRGLRQPLKSDSPNLPFVVAPEGAPDEYPLNIQVDGVRVKSQSVPAYASFAHGVDLFQKSYPRDVIRMIVKGPYDIHGQTETVSQRKIFICRPSGALTETACARRIFAHLAGQAYRRPVSDVDVARLMKVYTVNRKGADFDQGIEAGVEAILVSPDFLFMRETPPAGAPGALQRVSDLELATRLSFFLWSSLPDQPLLAAAERGDLHKPVVLRQQIDRMLADRRADALADNFAGQWLYLRDLQFQKPNLFAYPKFDEPLREAMLTETDLFFMSVVRDNRSVLDFIDSDYTFLNQRLAEHYGIPGVSGPGFRKVALDPAWHRGGLFGQASVLTVTSFNDRTSIVRRGKWILDNILVSPVPPPPPNVPALDEVKGAKTMTVREQMEVHRANPVCATCHNKIDPLGFSLENYDAVGAWRTQEAGKTIDVLSVMPDGGAIDGVAGLKKVLMQRKDLFAQAFIERFITYALGRGVEPEDRPYVRAIQRQAAADGYRMDTIIDGIAQSTPFQMRKVPAKPDPSTNALKVAAR